MPLSAAFSVWMPLEMPSSRLVKSLERLDSADAVKKLVGLSRALLTFLPVDRRPCVRFFRSAVLCRLRRFERTPDERVIPEVTVISFLGNMGCLQETSQRDIAFSKVN